LCLDLIVASLSRNTWKRYNSAYNLWLVFCEKAKINPDIEKLSSCKSDFIIWCWKRGSPSVNTIKIYLSELSKLESLALALRNGGENLDLILLKGLENLRSNEKRQSRPVTPVTVKILTDIRSSLAKEKDHLSGQSVWTCCLVAFWGAFRLSELLGKTERGFDKFSDLLWEDIRFEADKVKIKIK
jgi:hypothetical protein